MKKDGIHRQRCEPHAAFDRFAALARSARRSARAECHKKRQDVIQAGVRERCAGRIHQRGQSCPVVARHKRFAVRNKFGHIGQRRAPWCLHVPQVVRQAARSDDLHALSP